jgi:cell division protein FtsL
MSMELETVFYVMGIIFMGLMLIIMVAITIAILVIRSKIIAIERSVSEKLHGVSDLAGKVGEFFRATKEVVNGK